MEPKIEFSTGVKEGLMWPALTIKGFAPHLKHIYLAIRDYHDKRIVKGEYGEIHSVFTQLRKEMKKYFESPDELNGIVNAFMNSDEVIFAYT